MFSISEFAARPGFEAANWPMPGTPWSDKFELMARLQTTLDLPLLLEMFSEHLDGVMRHQGIRFLSVKGPAGEIDQAYGIGLHAGLPWRILMNIEGQELGWLEIHVDEIPPKELQTAAFRLIRCLMFPLKNALRFERIQHQALLDEVTGLGSRAAFVRFVEQEIARVKRSKGKSSLALLVMDLDDFKKINDQFGHLAGDQALRQAADAARSGLRDGDRLFRYGGDEFVALLPDADARAAAKVALRLEKMVQSNCTDPDLSITVGASQWIAEMDSVALFEAADRALYARKSKKRSARQANSSIR